jgi:hypothetical protein
MSSKYDDDYDEKNDAKYSGKYDDEDDIVESRGVGDRQPPPKIEVLDIEFDPPSGPLSGPLELKIKFELDRDVVAGYWIIKYLVDSCDRRLIRVSSCFGD